MRVVPTSLYDDYERSELRLLLLCEKLLQKRWEQGSVVVHLHRILEGCQLHQDVMSPPVLYLCWPMDREISFVKLNTDDVTLMYWLQMVVLGRLNEAPFYELQK